MDQNASINSPIYRSVSPQMMAMRPPTQTKSPFLIQPTLELLKLLSPSYCRLLKNQKLSYNHPKSNLQ